MSNKYLSGINEDYDFGFTFTDDEKLAEVTITKSDLPGQVQDMKERLEAIQVIYLPLLEKLNEHPERPYIKWEGRKKILEEHIAKLKQLTSF